MRDLRIQARTAVILNRYIHSSAHLGGPSIYGTHIVMPVVEGLSKVRLALRTWGGLGSYKMCNGRCLGA